MHQNSKIYARLKVRIKFIISKNYFSINLAINPDYRVWSNMGAQRTMARMAALQKSLNLISSKARAVKIIQ